MLSRASDSSMPKAAGGRSRVISSFSTASVSTIARADACRTRSPVRSATPWLNHAPPAARSSATAVSELISTSNRRRVSEKRPCWTLTGEDAPPDGSGPARPRASRSRERRDRLAAARRPTKCKGKALLHGLKPGRQSVTPTNGREGEWDETAPGLDLQLRVRRRARHHRQRRIGAGSAVPGLARPGDLPLAGPDQGTPQQDDRDLHRGLGRRRAV